MTPLATEIRRLRKDAELTQDKLAEILGVTQGFITQLETGRSKGVTVETLFKLAAALGVSCEHFAPYFAEDAPDKGLSGGPGGPPKKPAPKAKRKGKK